MLTLQDMEGYNVDAAFIHQCIDAYKNGELTVAVTGEFSSGKTCLINALLGKEDFLPSGDTECTPIYIDISGGSSNGARLIHQSGHIESLEYSEEVIQRYARYVPGYPEGILGLQLILSAYPFNSRIHLLDCPGTNTIVKSHEIINESAVRKSDVILYTINKVAKMTALKEIKQIYDYNEDIIFVLTHMDESETGQYLSATTIQKYVVEARNTISDYLGVKPERITILPIGSKLALTERSLLDDIINLIESKNRTVNQEKLREKARAKIASHIESAISIERGKLTALKNAKDMNSEELDDAIRTSQKKLEEANCNLEKQSKRIEIDSRENAEGIKKRIVRLTEEHTQRICGEITHTDECTRSKVRDLLEHGEKRYNDAVVQAIKGKVMSIADTEYASANDQLKCLADEVLLPQSLIPQIDPPDFDDRTELEFGTSQSKYEAMLSQIDDEMSLLKEEQAEKNRQIDEENRKVEETEAKRDAKYAEKMELGGYVPEYKPVHVEGKSRAYGQIGRVLGEIADVALILWNPGGGAAGATKGAAEGAATAAKGAETAAEVISAADKVKDRTKISQYFLKAVGGVKKVKAAASAVHSREQSTDEYALQSDDEDEAEEGLVLKALDLISVAHWGEVLGSKIGEAVMPDEDVMVEDEQVKAAYFGRQAAIDDELEQIAASVVSRENKIDDLKNDVVNNRIRERELLNRREQLQREREADERIQDRRRKEKVADEEKKYYCDRVVEYFKQLEEQNEEAAGELIERVSELLRKAASDSAGRIIRSLSSELESLSDRRKSLLDEIAECEGKLSELDHIDDSIDSWIAEE